MPFLGGVIGLNGGIWHCEGPGFKRIGSKRVHGLIQLVNTFCMVFVAYQPPRCQYSPLATRYLIWQETLKAVTSILRMV